jgi:hypothetical protein
MGLGQAAVFLGATPAPGTHAPVETNASGVEDALVKSVNYRTRWIVTLFDEVHEILDPGVVAIEDGKHPDIGDAMNLLGRGVAAVEHLAKRIDEQLARGGSP